ncbi:MAG: helix-turn-helix domain-containing protein [Clostridiales bacterium]|nr:helix-turn-helix domain-containing protein [Clostridiales bacterium]
MPDTSLLTFSLPVRLLSAGICETGPGWLHPRRRLDSSVLIVMQRGSFVMGLDDASVHAQPGQALLLPAGRLHYGISTDPVEPPAYCWAHFVDGVDAPHSVSLPVHMDRLPPTVYTRVAGLFHQLISERSCGAPAQLSCDYLMSLMLIELGNDRREETRSAAFNRVSEYIRNHFAENLTLARLSEHFGYSEDYLSRLIRANTRTSFRDYLHRFRLERARRELLSTDKTVMQIAAECGYVNAKHFSTVFARSEGMPPTSFRDLYGKQHQAQ